MYRTHIMTPNGCRCVSAACAAIWASGPHRCGLVSVDPTAVLNSLENVPGSKQVYFCKKNRSCWCVNLDAIMCNMPSMFNCPYDQSCELYHWPLVNIPSVYCIHCIVLDNYFTEVMLFRHSICWTHIIKGLLLISRPLTKWSPIEMIGGIWYFSYWWYTNVLSIRTGDCFAELPATSVRR